MEMMKAVLGALFLGLLTSGSAFSIVAILASMRFCPQCGEMVSPHSIFCPYCLVELKDNCPQCGELVEKDRGFCLHCDWCKPGKEGAREKFLEIQRKQLIMQAQCETWRGSF